MNEDTLEKLLNKRCSTELAEAIFRGGLPFRQDQEAGNRFRAAKSASG